MQTPSLDKSKITPFKREKSKKALKLEIVRKSDNIDSSKEEGISVVSDKHFVYDYRSIKWEE